MLNRTQNFRTFVSVTLFLLMFGTANLAALAVLAQDATPYTRGEMYRYIAGNTQTLSNGSAYYADDGTLQVRIEGKDYTGSWSTNKQGMLCWHVYDLDDIPCDTYLHDNEGTSVIQGGIQGGVISIAPELKDGNTLQSATTKLEQFTAKKKFKLPEQNFFTRGETIAFLSGKTSLREAGGRMFYGPDFILTTNWNGITKSGTWNVNDKGGVCWEVTGWGKTPCEYYFYKKAGGLLWARFRDRDTAAAPHIDGDQTMDQ